MLEVIAAIAILAIAAAIVVPRAVGSTEAQFARDTKTDLESVAAANATFYTASGNKAQLGRVFFASVKMTGGTLGAAGVDTTSCNGLQPAGGTSVVAYTAALANTWTGPYITRTNTRGAGFVTGIGVIDDLLIRTAANGTAGQMKVSIPSVRLEDAQALNTLVDGQTDTNASNADKSNTTPTATFPSVVYTAPNSQLLVTVTYRFTINKEC